ncbi:hypothetical protein IW262DRAFT_346019 [Armillaria fumosa]|nr:hypothetical protein IW262DRAFT_346019 [Armillaria fumosa]
MTRSCWRLRYTMSSKAFPWGELLRGYSGAFWRRRSRRRRRSLYEQAFTKKCVPFSVDVVRGFNCYMKTFTHCDLQTRVLLVPPLRRSSHIHVPRRPILPSGTQTIEPYNLAKFVLVALDEYFQIQDDSSTFPSRPSGSGRSARISWIRSVCGAVNTALDARAAKGPR